MHSIRIEVRSSEFTFADRELGTLKDNNCLHAIKYKGVNFGSVCSVSLREDSGTLWTEEYSWKKYVYDKYEEVISFFENSEFMRISTAASAPSFIEMWPGFSQLSWTKQYSFHKTTGMIKIDIELNWLGNSTEIALRWESATIDSCVAEVPFGSIVRTPLSPSPDTIQGDVFPVLNWVKTGKFVIFNKGTPGHAIREGKLETVLLRSPVKRWSPWFPVTPDETAYDNGIKNFSFVWMPITPTTTNGNLHRLGMEFNFGLPVRQATRSTFMDMPENLVLSTLLKKNKKTEALIFEAEGRETVWKKWIFSPYEIKKIFPT